MLKIEYSSRFKRDYKKIAKDQDTVAKIREVLMLLVNEKQLPAKNRRIRCQAIIKIIWNATLSRIYCSFIG